MRVALNLVDGGVISAEMFVAAVRYQAEQRPPLGELAVRKGKLTMHQLFEVLKRQADDPRFLGELAREMRFLTRRQLADLLLLQSEMTPTIEESLIAVGADARLFEPPTADEARLEGLRRPHARPSSNSLALA